MARAASRDEDKGLAAVSLLAGEGFQTQFLQLDVLSQTSIQNAVDEFKRRFTSLDILINNAGIFLPPSKIKSGEQTYAYQVENTLAVNFFGTLDVCNAFFPILSPGARVVHVSSRLADPSILGQNLQRTFQSESLTVDQLAELMKEYSRHVKQGSHVQQEWPEQPLDTYIAYSYSISKLAVSTLARIQARDMESDQRKDILINACCPGWIQTDLGGSRAPMTVKEGAVVPLYLAFLPPGGYNGIMYFR